METRKVEAYIGYTNYQWDTKVVEIPSDIPEKYVLRAVESEILNTFNSKQREIGEITFIGIYNDNLEVL